VEYQGHPPFASYVGHTTQAPHSSSTQFLKGFLAQELDPFIANLGIPKLRGRQTVASFIQPACSIDVEALDKSRVEVAVHINPMVIVLDNLDKDTWVVFSQIVVESRTETTPRPKHNSTVDHAQMR
jgi:hypothetical protein